VRAPDNDFGTKGQLTCTDSDTVRHFDFLTNTTTDHHSAAQNAGMEHGMGGHGGADYHLMRNWVDAVSNKDWSHIGTTARDTLASHLLVFAAEEARVTGKVVSFSEFASRR